MIHALSRGLTLAACVMLAACGPSDSADAVATVAGAPITAAEFAEAYANVALQTGLEGPDPAAADAVLDGLISRRLLIADAVDDGIEETEAYQRARALAETKELVDRYTAREMNDALRVTDRDLREQFAQMHTTYAARHLYARDRDAADRLRDRLRAGETFETLAAETFADPDLAASGGSLGEFGHDDMDPALEAVAFRLPIGEVSEPVRTATGYSVLRVDARATSPLLTEAEFARRRDGIARYVRRRKRTEARFALGRSVRDDLAPRFEPETFERLVAFAAGRAPGLDAEALADWRRRPLVRFQSNGLGSVWTVGDVEDRAATMTDRQRAAVQDAATLRDFVEGLLVREEIAARARAGGLDEGLDRALRTRMDEWVFAEAKRRLRLVDIPEDSLRAVYDRDPSVYRVPERVRAREILVATRAEADALRRRVAAGERFGDLARRHSLRLGAAQADGSLGPVTRTQLGRLADPVFAARPGEIVGPIEVQGRYAIVERGETVAPRPMTFREALPDLRAALDVPLAQRRLAATLADLRERYPVAVHRGALDRVLAGATLAARPAPRPDRS